MKFLRRFLGVLVMGAGILGLVLSLAGLIAIWVLKPTVADSASKTIDTLNSAVTTSQDTMQITRQALGATVDSVDALSSMLSTTAISVEDTQPVLDQLNTFLGDVLPSTLESATSSLETAQQAAVVLDGAIKSLDTFRAVLSGVPLIGGLIEQPTSAYNPEVPLADSLGELAINLESLPDTFIEMSINLSSTDKNLGSIQANLTTMSQSVGLISSSLGEYEKMVVQSQSSMDNLRSMLSNLQSNLTSLLNAAVIVLTLLLLWFLATQVYSHLLGAIPGYCRLHEGKAE
jgi:uncharacterized coiled-coil protein SlyX